MAVYQELDRDVFRSKKEYSGSVINQIDKVLEYFDLCNEVRVIIDGSPMRKEILSYNKRAARECILNCYCHRDYSRKSNIKIEFFDDRCEILSPGSFYDGLTLEDALNGVQSFRNENLVKLLFRLGYIENYASGLIRVFNEYIKVNLVPAITTNLSMFKVTLPNINYEAFNQGDKDNALEAEAVDWVNNILLKLEDQRDIDIIKAIEEKPGIKTKGIVDMWEYKYPEINYNIIAKRIKKYSNIIEFIGSKRTGGYYLKDD